MVEAFSYCSTVKHLAANRSIARRVLDWSTKIGEIGLIVGFPTSGIQRKSYNRNGLWIESSCWGLEIVRIFGAKRAVEYGLAEIPFRDG